MSVVHLSCAVRPLKYENKGCLKMETVGPPGKARPTSGEGKAGGHAGAAVSLSLFRAVCGPSPSHSPGAMSQEPSPGAVFGCVELRWTVCIRVHRAAPTTTTSTIRSSQENCSLIHSSTSFMLEKHRLYERGSTSLKDAPSSKGTVFLFSVKGNDVLTFCGFREVRTSRK